MVLLTRSINTFVIGMIALIQLSSLLLGGNIVKGILCFFYCFCLDCINAIIPITNVLKDLVSSTYYFPLIYLKSDDICCAMATASGDEFLLTEIFGASNFCIQDCSGFRDLRFLAAFKIGSKIE